MRPPRCPAVLLSVLALACGPTEVVLGDTQGVARVVAGVLGVKRSVLVPIDSGPAGVIPLAAPVGVALAPDGSFWVSDRQLRRVAHVSVTGDLTWPIGAGLGCGLPRPGPGPARAICLGTPGALALLPDGRLAIADDDAHRIYLYDPADSTVGVLAGTGAADTASDGATAAQAPVHGPAGIRAAPDGSLWVAERLGCRILRIDPAGVLHVVAGSGVPGNAGDGGPAVLAELRFPTGVDVAGDTVYIADTRNHRIRRVVGGVIEPLAGLGYAGYGGDRQGAGLAVFARPTRVLAVPGLLFVVDNGNDRIRVIRLAADSIDTWAGTGDADPGADLREPAATAVLGPQDLSAAGRVMLFADSGGFVVRRVIR